MIAAIMFWTFTLAKIGLAGWLLQIAAECVASFFEGV